ncbi:ATP-binding protein [Candidatus Zixiibacteriota bacterium]
MKNQTIEKKYRSNPNAVVKAERLTEKVGRKCEVDTGLMQDICIAVTEAVNNAVEHGNNLESDKFVTLRFDCSRESLKITVEDQGNGFDVTSVDDPLTPENLTKPNGRGLLIVESLMDEVKIVPSIAGTVIVMVKNLVKKS